MSVRYRWCASGAVLVLLVMSLTSCTGASPTEDPPRSAAPSKEAGWDSDITFDGAVHLPVVPEAQQSTLSADFSACMKKYPPVPPTTSEIAEWYQAELINRRCLIDLGYDMPQPPTEQVYVDGFETASQWRAMNDASPDAMDRDTYVRVFTECPSPSFFGPGGMDRHAKLQGHGH